MQEERQPVFDKWAILDGIGYDPHPGQLLVAESTARHRVLAAGRRFGKSDVGGHELIPECLYTYTQVGHLESTGKDRRFWVVGPEYSDAEKEFRVIWNELSKLEVPFDKPGSYNDPIGGSLHLSCFGGKFQVHGKSAKYPDQLVGEALCGVIMAEAAKQRPVIWPKYIRPMLADFDGWSLHSSTPEGKNHFYDLYNLGRDPGVPEFDSWRMPSWVNPYVYKTPTKALHVKELQRLMREDLIQATEEYDAAAENKSRLRWLCDRHGLIVDKEILELLASTSEIAFNQEIAAEFTDYVGRVFPDFDEDIHVGDLPYNPKWATYAGVDYGFRNPNVWLVIQVGPWGEINIIREFYQEGLTAQEFAEEVKARNLDRGVIAFYPDPASPGDTAVVSDYLKIPARGGTGGDLNPRLDAIRRALKETPLHVPRGHIDRRPQMMWDRSCVKSIYEMGEYRYPEMIEQQSRPTQEKPLKRDDHSPEALGRFMAGHFTTPQEDAGPGRITKAKYVTRPRKRPGSDFPPSPFPGGRRSRI